MNIVDLGKNDDLVLMLNFRELNLEVKQETKENYFIKNVIVQNKNERGSENFMIDIDKVEIVNDKDIHNFKQNIMNLHETYLYVLIVIVYDSNRVF